MPPPLLAPTGGEQANGLLQGCGGASRFWAAPRERPLTGCRHRRGIVGRLSALHPLEERRSLSAAHAELIQAEREFQVEVQALFLLIQDIDPGEFVDAS